MIVNILYMYELLGYFIIFSFFGWCLEVVYQATSKGLIINRGFLNGPVCPIYGFGIISLKLFFSNLTPSSLEIFLYGVIFSTIIELIGGYILFKIFKCRWWDYSDKPFNLKGYICLEFSLIWGIGVLLTVKLIWPTIDKINFDNYIIHICIICALILMIIDFILSIIFLIGLHKKINELSELRHDLRKTSDKLSEFIGTNALETKNKIEYSQVKLELAKVECEEDLKEKLNNFDKYINKTKYFGGGRFINSFPHLKNTYKK